MAICRRTNSENKKGKNKFWLTTKEVLHIKSKLKDGHCSFVNLMKMQSMYFCSHGMVLIEWSQVAYETVEVEEVT